MKLTYLGHACFKIESGDYSIIIDPYAPGSVPGYASLDEQANLVLCTHEHGDHNSRSSVTLKPETSTPFEITQIPSWHDDQQGALRGPNTIYILRAENLTVIHLGDLGCRPDAKTLSHLAHADVLLIPVGGHYTIDAATASSLTDLLNPKVVIPMHYRGPGFGYDVIAPVSEFLSLRGSVHRSEECSIQLPRSDIPEQTSTQVLVLKSKYRMG